jgi:hypothetical protein
VTVFGDHEDKDQFYYLPEVVRISTDREGKPQFTLLKYMRDITDNPQFTEGQQLGGGFVIFTVDLALDDDTRTEILRLARRMGSSRPRLASAPFHEGQVRLIGLDSEAEPVAGEVRFVETVHGTSKPSFFGDLRATFSAKLSQEAVEAVEQAYAKGGQPFGVVYDLQFLGLRPAIDVTVKADMSRIFNYFNAKVAAQYMLLRAEIEAGFQKLEEERAYEITINTLSDDAETRELRNEAVRFFREDMLRDFFTPSLPLPREESSNLLGGLSEMLRLPQMSGRTLGQATGGATPAAAPPTPVAQPVSAPAAPPAHLPGGPTGDATPAGIRAGSDTPALAPAAPRSAPPPPTPSAAAATGGAPATTPAGGGGNLLESMAVGFKIKIVRTEELRILNARWREASAVERTHAPNGTFGLMLRGLKRSEHFIEVNLDSTFFQRIKVDVECPTPFEAIGLKQIKAHLEYGDRGDGQPRHVDDLELRPDQNGNVVPQTFMSSLDEEKNLHYRYRLDFFFDPTSPIRAQQTHYTTDMFTSIDRTLTIDPGSYVGLLDVGAAIGELDFAQIPRVQVKIGYNDERNDFQVEDTFILTAAQPNFNWKVRLSDPQQREYWYDVTYFLQNDQRITLPRQFSASRSLVINEPWQDRIKLLLDAAYDESLRRLVVELEYHDPAVGYRFTQVKRITSEEEAFSNLEIPVLDPARKSFRYRVTAVGADNTVRRSEYVETTEEYLPIAAP